MDPQNPAAPPPAADPPAPPPAPPAPAQQPLPGVPPAASAPPPAAPQPPPGERKREKDILRIPQKKFAERVDRALNEKAKEVLGCTVEEAKALLEAAKKQIPEDPNLKANLEKLQRKVARLAEKNKAAKERVGLIRARERDRRMKTELQAAMSRAGIVDEHMDFALDLFKKHVRSEGDRIPKDAKELQSYTNSYFAGLRATRAYLFGEAAPAQPPARPVPPNRPSTAPPADPNARREEPPSPRGAPPPPRQKTVDEMDPQEFARYRRAQYGA